MLAQYKYTMIHLSGERIYWGNLVALLVNISAVAVRAVTVLVNSAPEETMLSNYAIREK